VDIAFDNRGMSWQAKSCQKNCDPALGTSCFAAILEGLKYTQPPYATTYPELVCRFQNVLSLCPRCTLAVRALAHPPPPRFSCAGQHLRCFVVPLCARGECGQRQPLVPHAQHRRWEIYFTNKPEDRELAFVHFEQLRALRLMGLEPERRSEVASQGVC
jgi:hypothetical protein